MHYLLLLLAIILPACDRSGPEYPAGSSQSELKADEEPNSSDENSPQETTEDIEDEQAAPDIGEKGFSMYRINILEMASACPGNTVNISSLRFMENENFLADSFKSTPNDPDPSNNVGTLGNYEVSLSTSGDYTDFYPFEAFGGGFGAGWWSSRDSFSNQAPYKANSDIWFQVSFGDEKVVLQKVFIRGGTTLIGEEFAACSPSHVQVQGSVDNGENWVLLSDEVIDSQAGATMSLSIPMAQTLN